MILPAISLPVFNPELFSFDIAGRHFAIHWYAISYVAGFIVAWRWFISLIRRSELWLGNKSPMQIIDADRLLTWIIIGVIIGGRLGYTLFYNPIYYLNNPLEIFAVWQGGMSFHGGFTGLIVAVIIFCRLNRLSIANVGDAISLVCLPGLFFGRVANFVNAELWGEPSQLPWAVIYLEGPASICPPDWTGICSRHPSQLYEAMLEGAVLCAIFAWLVYRKGAFKIPGQLIGLFFIGYGISRSFVELFRVADPQMRTTENPQGYIIQLFDWGLTMGQVLSIPMIFIGVSVLVWSRRKRK